MVNNKSLSDEERRLIQTKHRLEEAESRNRKKERRERTRRLIQEGAILEKIIPEIKGMPLDMIELELVRRYSIKWEEKS